MGINETQEVDIGNCIPGDHKTGIVNEFFGKLNRACRAEIFACTHIFNVHPEFCAIAEIGLNFLRKIEKQQNDVGDFVLFQKLDGMFQNGPIHDRNHWLGEVAGQGSQPGA